MRPLFALFALLACAAAPAEQHIEVRTMREVKQVLTHFPAPGILLLSATTISVQKFRFYRLTVSPPGDVTQIRIIKPATDTVGLSKTDTIMLRTLVQWKANPSTTTRIVDVELRPFLEGNAH
jgi:hypothetical protein